MSDATRLAGDLLRLAGQYTAANSWLDAGSEAITHLLLVRGNNVKKPWKAIFARPDVKEALTFPFITAGKETVEDVINTFAIVAPNVDMKVVKAELKPILASIRRNVRQAAPRLRKEATSKKPDMEARLQAVVNDLARRAQFAVDYAQKRAETVAKIDAAGDGAKKTWMGPQAQCSACQALHGTTIPVQDEFDAAAGGLNLGTFAPLLGPPRHPNCKCYLVVS